MIIARSITLELFVFNRWRVMPVQELLTLLANGWTKKCLRITVVYS